ncbi:hypothetical protein BsWGS_26492 [Bradybaena similaris]
MSVVTNIMPNSTQESSVARNRIPNSAQEMSVATNRMPNSAQVIPNVADKLLADSDRSLAFETIPDNAAVMCDVDTIPAVADEISELLQKLPAEEQTPNVVDEIVNGISVADGISGVDETSSAIDAIPAVVQETLFSVEKDKLLTGPEDKTLLDLIERASPDLAIEFLKEFRFFSQATLNSALILACQRGFKYLVQKLVQLGADIECRDASGKTPLLICVENRHFDLVHFLVAKSADVKAVDCAGNNALILSISFAGSKEMTRFLLAQSGITINHQNKEGYTAVMKALEVRDVDTVKLLLEGYHHQHVNEQSCHKYEDSKSWTLLDQTVNCKGETSQEIAEKYGLGDVFELLKECRYKRTSPLLAAVTSYDLEMVTFLLDSEIKPTLDVENIIIQMFEEHCKNERKAFTKTEVAIIKRLLEYCVNCKWHKPANCTHNYVSIAVEAGDYNLVELLCKHGVSPNQLMHRSDELPLSVAAKHGRVDLIELLLKYNADVNKRSVCNYIFDSALLNEHLDYAFLHGHIDCARFLISHGAKLDIGLALISAVMNQSPEYMKLLFQNYKSEIIEYFIDEPKNGNDLFLEAVQRGNLEIIELFLQLGVDVNKLQPSGSTPIAESKNGEVAQLLVNCGANVNHVTSITNETPLMHVLSTHSTHTKAPCKAEIARVLLENGASVHAKTIDGTTPLMLAARLEGHEVTLQTLLDHGTDCSDKDNDGNTALMHAMMTCSPKNAMFLIQFMKNNTYLLNLRNNEGFSALMCDVSRGACTDVSELIDGGADVNITDVDGNTVLHLAATTSMSQSNMRAMINAGCDVNYQNNQGVSHLMLAVRMCDIAVVSTLLSLGADVNAVSHKDASKTALSCVPKEHSHTEKALCCIKLLLENGAEASYLNQRMLQTIITQGPHELIAMLIHCGLGPFDNYAEIGLRFGRQLLIPSVSPVGLALLAGDVSLARYFWDHMFLTNFDLFSLFSNKTVRCFLECNNLKECLSFLDKTSSEPVSLFKMCFVAVTSAVGASPGRETRINKLPLPQVMKDNLLFKPEFGNTRLQRQEQQHVTSCQ